VKRFAIGAVLVLALAAGCGGGGSKTLTKAEYASQLNRLCADYNARINAIGRPATPADLATKGPKLLAEFEKTISKAEKLEAPAELEADAAAFVDAAKELDRSISALLDAAKKNDSAKVGQLVTKADAVAARGDALGRKLGAPACAEG
jgi:hypothetical protein